MSFSIGKVFGIKIKIHFTWFLIFALIAWTLAVFYLPSQFPGLSVTIYWIIGTISALLLFVSVLVHELAHSYVAIKKGLPVSSITLYLFGGISEIETEPSDAKTEAIVSVVGPLTSFAIAGISAAAWFVVVAVGLGTAFEAPLFYIAVINILLGAFNLLPAFPLDGGRLLRAAIWQWKKDLVPATKTATKISKIFAYSIIGFGFFSILFINFISGLWLVFIGWFLRNGADQSLKQTIIMQAISDLDVGQIMTKTVITVPPEKTISEAENEFFNIQKHGGFPVVKDNQIVGIITRDDLKSIQDYDKQKRRVEDIMTPRSKLIFLRPNESVADAFMKFSKNNIGRMPVLEEETVVGIVTRSDVIRAVQVKTQESSETKVEREKISLEFS
ncbi:MAG: CBS domain-containing protein [Alphaproteobacteria bacterium]|nr:MAG: CBS domain-containing protein [Alphaproteobacteria bacterium]